MSVLMNLRDPLVIDGQVRPEARTERGLADARYGETLAEYAARVRDGVIYRNVIDDMTTIDISESPGVHGVDDRSSRPAPAEASINTVANSHPRSIST